MMRATTHPILKTCVVLVSVVLLGCAFSQTASDQISLITSALQKEDFARALELLRPALERSPGNAQLWAMQGAAYAGESRKQDALASFRAALKISPDYLPALKGAIPLLQRVLRGHPADQTSHGMLAVLEYQQGNCAGAVAQFEKAGALFDSRPDGLHAYAACLVKEKEFDKAAG